jgi:hypothetical protein
MNAMMSDWFGFLTTHGNFLGSAERVGLKLVEGKLASDVILSPHFGRRTPVVYSFHRLPRNAGVFRFAQDDSIESFFRNL